MAAGRTLMATSRASRGSRARYTSPIPPAPSGARIWYGPSSVPFASGMCGLSERIVAWSDRIFASLFRRRSTDAEGDRGQAAADDDHRLAAASQLVYGKS